MRTHFILVGLLYLCGVSISQECHKELWYNRSFLGFPVASLYSPDVEHCQLLCTQHPECLFFTFVRPGRRGRKEHFSCFLKSSIERKPELRAIKRGLTSGFSLKPCNPDPQPCLSQVYQNVDFPGGDYDTLFTADYEECQRACTHDPTCHFFTFNNGNFTSAEYRYKCQLKFSWTVPRTPRIDISAFMADGVSGFSHKIQISQPYDTVCQTTLFLNTDIPGNDMETLIAASPEHCQALCSAHPRCSYFSYTRGYRCYLKNNSDEMVVQAKDGITSGLPARSCQLDNNWVKKHHEKRDFWGSDIRNLGTDDAEACQRNCTEDPNCQFFTFVSKMYMASSRRVRTCYLKRVIILPAPPKVTRLADVVSGFALKNCVKSTLQTRTETQTAEP